MRLGVRRAAAAAAVVAAALVTVPGAALADEGTPRDVHLYLLTLQAPGLAGYGGALSDSAYGRVLEARQDQVLATVGASTPVYRWTTALSGMAVDLTDQQALELRSLPSVAAVERDQVRPLAALAARDPRLTSRAPAGNGGRGVVIGVVDSGIWTDSPVFAAVPGLGPVPSRFRGDCVEAPTGLCDDKVVGARWFVAGFGSSRVASASSLSPLDDSGHGTLVASIAGGNEGVSVLVGDERLGTYSGAAPLARLAVYKACWTAPDPAHDGCSTADVVTAIDRATADRVDVLNLSVGGTTGVDTVERALLGATQAGVFVAAAAGNTDDGGHAAHATPWVTTVAATANPVRGGVVALPDGTTLPGAMASRTTVTAPLVDGRDIPAPTASAADAALCLPGSLDAARALGRIVLCERGSIGRVDKSGAVALADGVGLVLADQRPTDLHADFHAVPTVHVPRDSADQLRVWLGAHPEGLVTLRPGSPVGAGSVPAWSAPGDPTLDLVKPDLAAAGVDALGARPPTADDAERWNTISGTSAATARVSGLAARIIALHRGWGPDRVRSALMTSAAPLAATSSLRQGAGRIDGDAALQPGLVYVVPVRDYVRYLAGRLPGSELNLPAIKVSGPAVVRRTLTSVGGRPMYYSVSATGFSRHRVTVQPEAIRIRPRGHATYTVTITGPADRLPDSGWITWLGNNGITVRIPVVIAR